MNLLGALIAQRHWRGFDTFAARFESAARDLGRREDDAEAAKLTLSRRQFVRWQCGEVKTLPRPAACRVLEAMFGHSATDLFAPARPVAEAGLVLSGPLSAGESGARWEQQGSTHAPTGGEDPIMSAARESGDFLRFAEATNVGPHTIEQFQADIRRLTSVYLNRPVMPIFHEARALRDHAFELLVGRQHPAHTRDLYLIAGQLCGILTYASFDLGHLAAAETHARTALLCGELAGHNGLRSWVRGTMSMIAYWDERPRDAIALARSGWDLTPESGAARVRLASFEARAHARLRDAVAVDDTLARAEQAREQVVGEDEPGGCMAFPLVMQRYCAGGAHVLLGGETRRYREAEREAVAAVELYLADPPERRRLGELCLARLDIADARLGQGDLDGAAVQAREVIASSARRRTEPVLRRIRQISDRLDQPKFHRSPLALRLRDEIRSFAAVPPPAVIAE